MEYLKNLKPNLPLERKYRNICSLQNLSFKTETVYPCTGAIMTISSLIIDGIFDTVLWKLNGALTEPHSVLLEIFFCE